MPKIRRAGSICLLIVVAAGAMVLARWLGLRPDPEMTRFLNSPSAVERLAEQGGAARAETRGKAKSPLVVQAEALALILDPPKLSRQTPSPQPRPRVARAEVGPVAASPVTAKFRLAGISYHRSKPAESRALVWEVGGGCRWVAQGAELGHVTVRQINRGSILYEDAAGMHEMALELDATPAMPGGEGQA